MKPVSVIAVSTIVQLAFLGYFGETVAGLSVSGQFWIRHHALRLMFFRNGSIPWNYARFLNYGTKRLLLQ